MVTSMIAKLTALVALCIASVGAVPITPETISDLGALPPIPDWLKEFGTEPPKPPPTSWCKTSPPEDECGCVPAWQGGEELECAPDECAMRKGSCCDYKCAPKLLDILFRPKPVKPNKAGSGSGGKKRRGSGSGSGSGGKKRRGSGSSGKKRQGSGSGSGSSGKQHRGSGSGGKKRRGSGSGSGGKKGSGRPGQAARCRTIPVYSEVPVTRMVTELVNVPKLVPVTTSVTKHVKEVKEVTELLPVTRTVKRQEGKGTVNVNVTTMQNVTHIATVMRPVTQQVTTMKRVTRQETVTKNITTIKRVKRMVTKCSDVQIVPGVKDGGNVPCCTGILSQEAALQCRVCAGVEWGIEDELVHVQNQGAPDEHGCNGSLPPPAGTKWDPLLRKCVEIVYEDKPEPGVKDGGNVLEDELVHVHNQGGPDEHGCNGSLPPPAGTKWDPLLRKCVEIVYEDKPEPGVKDRDNVPCCTGIVSEIALSSGQCRECAGIEFGVNVHNFNDLTQVNGGNPNFNFDEPEPQDGEEWGQHTWPSIQEEKVVHSHNVFG